MMDRRAFVVGSVSALVGPIAADAQRAARLPRIGVLALLKFSDLTLQSDAFRDGLRDVGYIEGDSILVEYLSADGLPDSLNDLATELLRLHVALIVSQTTPATAAVARATAKIPIVMLAVADPIGSGFIDSLGRPGRNATGFSLMLVDIGAKRLEILKTLLPGVSRVAVLWNPTNPAQKLMLPPTEMAAQKFGLSLQLVGLTSSNGLSNAFEGIARARAEAILVFEDSVTVGSRKRIVALADQHRLPSMYGARAFLDEGGLIGYAPNDAEQYRRAGIFISKILKGSDPRGFLWSSLPRSI